MRMKKAGSAKVTEYLMEREEERERSEREVKQVAKLVFLAVIIS